MTTPTINVDVSDLVRTRGKTGIQRVLREVASRLLTDTPAGYTVRIVRFNYAFHYFEEIARDDALRILFDSDSVPASAVIRIEDFGPQDIFYDIDAVWGSPLKRAYLYKRLKSQGVTIFATVYDFVPIKFPAFAFRNTVRVWPAYIAAVFAYADLVFVDSRATERDFADYRRQFGITREIPTVVTKLGGDFTPVTTRSAVIDRVIVDKFINEPYLLFVGSIEPRKMQMLALDAMKLISKVRPDVHLVIAGKMGWNSGAVNHRIVTDPLHGRRIHWVNTPSDELLKELYDRCTIAVYHSHYEGFGLPVAESLSHGKITITSRNSSIYEVGHAYADYVHFNSATEVAETALAYLNSETAFTARTKQIQREFHPYSWDLVYTTIRAIFDNLAGAKAVTKRERSESLQVVINSENAEMLRQTIESLDAHMPFAREYVVLAPSSELEAMASIVSSRPLTIIDRDDALHGLADVASTPGQHVGWDIWKAVSRLDIVDAEFIAMNDRHRPLVDINITKFIGPDHRYNAYFFYELTEWPHRVDDFDRRQHLTRELLDRSGLELLSYASHQPQVVNKALLQEAVEFFAGRAVASDVDEWALYFNYVATRYPTLFTKRAYETMGWPATAASWELQYAPPAHSFEYYQPELYADGGEFAGLLPANGLDEKAARKEPAALRTSASASLNAELHDVIGELGLAHGTLTFSAPGVELLVAGVPQIIATRAGAPARLRPTFNILAKTTDAQVGFWYRITGKNFASGVSLEFPYEASVRDKSGVFEIPIYDGDLGAGTYDIEFFMKLGADEVVPAKAKYLAKLVVCGPDDSLEERLAEL
ncbi:glycosyltransferase family 1 protein [Glaciihabitans sp. dw_435]|uniref:glycosyltransferase family 4 protein n=1 Tax=Glaciihabitans sp. dw_435 TaxID=2720081 RepID=UPI001BD36EBE|nr:glycosyltransferase family 1 protein [Glaciihabitans sp. dw_435]